MAKKITSYQLAFSPVTNRGRVLFRQEGSMDIIPLANLSPEAFTATATILLTGRAHAEGHVIFMEDSGDGPVRFDTSFEE